LTKGKKTVILNAKNMAKERKNMAIYLFDFDGTLVDSMPTFIEAFMRVMRKFNIPIAKDLVKTITPLGYKGAAEHLRSLGVPLSTEELLFEVNAFAREAYHERILPKTHVKETLKALRARGDSLNILTASPHGVLDPCLKRNGIYELFDNVWSCEDFATTKADPNIYRMAAERLNAPVQDVIFLDDNYDADKTAKSAGMTVYGVFDASSSDYAYAIRAITDRYFTDFSELLED